MSEVVIIFHDVSFLSKRVFPKAVGTDSPEVGLRFIRSRTPVTASIPAWD
jgi:hypothetical protein